MNPESMPNPAAPKSETWGYRILIAAIFLVPLAFLPTNYISLDLVKACLIVLAVVVSAILYARVALKEKKILLPPRLIAWSALAVIVSVVASALSVHPIVKSFFGQGSELDTAGFIVILFAALTLAYNAISRRPERIVGIYAASIISFFAFELFHALRFIFGQGFASLGILQSLSSTVLGDWYALSTYALFVLIVIVSALSFLPLSRGMKIWYGLAALASFAGAFFVNDARAWGAAAIVFLGITLYATFSRPGSITNSMDGSIPVSRSWWKRIAWLPLLFLVISAVFFYKGGAITGPAITRIGANYSEIQLPWQLTLDVGAGAIKDSPILGAGPNRFTQAYIAHKPAEVNPTDAWGVEFTSGFGLIPTFFVTEGLLGILTWIVFLVFLGIVGARALRSATRRSDDPRAGFIIVSSYAASVFLWLMLIVSVPPHAIVFLAFITTGAFLGAAVSFGAASGTLAGWIVPMSGRYSVVKSSALWICVILAVCLGVVYAKDAIALEYFGAGASILSNSGNPSAADADFAKALNFNNYDLFWQARAEAGITVVQSIFSSVTSTSTASTTQAAATEASGIINQSLVYAQKAVTLDPSNYYNYVSEARVSSLGASISMTGAYDAAVKSYTQAISLNPQNPQLYLDLAQLQAQSNKLPDALQTLGVALQVKNNYLDAVYLLSQVEAAQGNLKDAITAAQVAVQINPQSPLLYFQLGLLQYNNADYSDATTTLSTALTLQSDYSNARYFLGLSYARLGQTSDALLQFNQLAAANPDDQTIVSIIATLKSGKSLFTPATTPAATAAKESKLPLKEKSQ